MAKADDVKAALAELEEAGSVLQNIAAPTQRHQFDQAVLKLFKMLLEQPAPPQKAQTAGTKAAA